MSPESPGTAQTPTETVPAGQAPGSEPTPQDVSAKPEHGPRTATVNLPFVKAQFRAPEMHLPPPHLGRAELSAAAHTVRSLLPPPRQALYYAGLAVFAAVEVIEWPVAAAIGVGAAVMSRSGREQRAERAGTAGETAAAGGIAPGATGADTTAKATGTGAPARPEPAPAPPPPTGTPATDLGAATLAPPAAGPTAAGTAPSPTTSPQGTEAQAGCAPESAVPVPPASGPQPTEPTSQQ